MSISAQIFLDLPKRQVMKPLRLLLLLLLIPTLGHAQILEKAAEKIEDFRNSFAQYESSVRVEKAKIWSRPGYTDDDCRPLNPKTAKYRNKSDRDSTHMRFEVEGREVCKAQDPKTDHIESGETIEIVIENGNPVFSDKFNIYQQNEIVEEIFYKVRTKSGKVGWISAGEISDPKPKETNWFVENIIRPAYVLCPERINSKSGDNRTKSLMNDWGKIKDKMDQDLNISKFKDRDELDRYICMYRLPKDRNAFVQKLDEFTEAANEAERVFGVPAPFLRCAMLTESQFAPGAESPAAAKGYTQFLSGTVKEVAVYANRPPYKEMWNRFKHAYPDAAMTNEKVRLKDHIPSATAAMAIYFRKMFDVDMQKSGCQDCMKDMKSIQRKDIYMLIAGYNAGPGVMKYISHRNSVDMRTTPPPVTEARNYMMRMERCLTKGHEGNFYEQTDDLMKLKGSRQAGINKIKNTQQLRKLSGKKVKPEILEKENARINELEHLVQVTAGHDYAQRSSECKSPLR